MQRIQFLLIPLAEEVLFLVTRFAGNLRKANAERPLVLAGVGNRFQRLALEDCQRALALEPPLQTVIRLFERGWIGKCSGEFCKRSALGRLRIRLRTVV